MESHKDIVRLLGGAKAVGRTVRSLADLDHAIQAGLPRAALEHLMAAVAPEGDRARLRNRVVPRASFQRSKVLSAAHSATTERLARVTALAQSVWEDDAKAQRFLWSEHPELGQRKPIEVALTELGAREVEEVIQRGLHGLPV
jgi:putative toxin-antitoxin system antitoxin component (TIGR02293 family)